LENNSNVSKGITLINVKNGVLNSYFSYFRVSVLKKFKIFLFAIKSEPLGNAFINKYDLLKNKGLKII
jgi:hypothetical protein